MLKCPKCSHSYPLSQSLIEPLLAVERAKLNEEVDLQVNTRLQQERDRIVKQEAAKAKQQYDAELKTAHESIAEKDRKLAEAQNNEATLRRERQQLADQKQELELTINRRLDQERDRIRTEQADKTRKELSVELKAVQDDLAAKDLQLTEAKKNELELRREREQLAQEKRDLDLTVQQRLDQERDTIRAEQADKVRKELDGQLQAAQQDIAARDAQLTEARKNELELRRDRQKLAEEKEQLDLTVQRRLDEERDKVREQTRRDADEQFRLKMAEKDKVITDTQKQLDEANRKMAQGSQQIQGDVAEADLESLLKVAFPLDEIEPIGKGREGGDRLHTVPGPGSEACGSILWERKRTKAWSNDWLEKARDDQRAANANLVVIVTDALPKNVATFDLIQGVWVCSPTYAIPLAKALRHQLWECAHARRGMEGRQEKESLVYAHVTGTSFRQQVGLMVEAIVSLQNEHEREKRAMKAIWAEREKQFDRLMSGTATIYSGFRGIIGGTLQQIPGLALPDPDAEAILPAIEPRALQPASPSVN
jgi:hypothetical protein